MEDAPIKDLEGKMGKAIAALHKEFSGLRTGLANPELLDPVVVDYHGTSMPLKHIANIATPDRRSMVITPYDPSSIKEIERGIQKANLNLSPVTDGRAVRINIPQPTEERRQDLIKLAHRLAEEARNSIRGFRRDANDAAKKSVKEKKISEDTGHDLQEKIQKLHDHFIEKAASLVAEKEKEIKQV